MSEKAYTTKRSDFTRLKDWAIELIGNDADFGWFVVQFQSCFGRSASYNPKNPVEDFKGFFLRYQKIADAMTNAGYEISLPTIKRYMPRMAELGIVSKAKVNEHPRSLIIYVLNYEAPFENDALAEKIAAKHREVSPYKNQAKNSAAKKARELQKESNEIVAAREIAQVLTSDNTLKSYVITYLTEDVDATVERAAKALKDLQTYSGRKTYPAFLAGTKAFNIYLTQAEETAVRQLRDRLNTARAADKPQEVRVEPPQIDSKPVLNTSWVKSKEQIITEQQMRKSDEAAQREEEIAAQFDELLKDLV